MTTRNGGRERRMTEWTIGGAAIGTPVAGAIGAAIGALIGLLASLAVPDRARERR